MALEQSGTSKSRPHPYFPVCLSVFSARRSQLLAERRSSNSHSVKVVPASAQWRSACFLHLSGGCRSLLLSCVCVCVCARAKFVYLCVFIPVSSSAALSSPAEVAIIAGNNSAFSLQVINRVTTLLAVSCCCQKKKKSNSNK